MTYKVGTRVKKVSGADNLGATGIVALGPSVDGSNVLTGGTDIFVRMDREWTGYRDDGTGRTSWPAGSVCRTVASRWVPIVPEGSDVPSEVTIHQLLDSKFYEKENCNV